MTDCIVKKYKLVRNPNLKLGVDVESPFQLIDLLCRKQADEAGHLREAGIRVMVSEIPLNKYQKPIVDASITACVAKTRTIPAGDFEEKLRESHNCLLTDFLNACPKDKQENSDDCKELRKGNFFT